ncbi:hypothetical protein ACGF7U_28550 [Micromonospora sp. NPDC047670]|uniref:hypothetical protein n=1 Tax=Micromonospora sp. NPDC047670 TaxID=3364252 RepID=UPI003723C425
MRRPSPTPLPPTSVTGGWQFVDTGAIWDEPQQTDLVDAALAEQGPKAAIPASSDSVRNSSILL